MMLIDNTSVIAASESKKELKLSGTVVLGGLPKAIPARGFRGCMSTLRINDRPVDILDEADDKAEVLQGCAGELLTLFSKTLRPKPLGSPRYNKARNSDG